MNRQELLASIKEAVSKDFLSFAENDDDPDHAQRYRDHADEVEGCTNLSEIAGICQNAAWDIAEFVGTVLAACGFEEADMSRDWLNEHAYGWDT